MLTTSDRLEYFALGCLIGFLAGYTIRMFVAKAGYRHPDDPEKLGSKFRNLALTIVVVTTAWAAFLSQNASFEVNDTQDAIVKYQQCNREILRQTINVLNNRTDSNRARVKANNDLQLDQASYLKVVLAKPDATSEEIRDALTKYFLRLQMFNAASKDTLDLYDMVEYPTAADFANC